MCGANSAVRLKHYICLVSCVMLLAVAVLPSAGCAPSPDWEAELRTPTALQEGVPADFVLLVKERGKPIVGLQVTGEFEMKRMDHGSVSVSFTDDSGGQYTGSVMLPMSGDWTVTVTMTDGKRTKREMFDIQLPPNIPSN